MNALDDTLRLVESWRTYRRMLADGHEPQPVYLRLVNDLAMVIRGRVRQ